MSYNAPERQIPVDVSRIKRWRSVEHFMSLPGGWQILRSGDLAWLYPVPTFRWYQSFYDENYRAPAERPVFHDEPWYQRRRLSYFHARLKRVVRHLGETPASLLEIGAGDGLFLVAARQLGIAATGIEVSAPAREDAKRLHGVDIIAGDLLSSDMPLADRYDLVVLNHVLEHLLTPLDYLARIGTLLSPRGLLVFEIPQQFINPIDLAYRALRIRRSLGVYTLHHPYFYTVSSTRRLMDTAGFRIERLTTWLPGQVFHVNKPWVTKPLQVVLWAADRLAKRGHVIEVFARPA